MRTVWSLYFGGDFSNVYVHAKEPESVAGNMRNRIIKPHIETEWGDISLVRAQNLLFREAFKDPNVTQVMLLSDSCAPLYNIRQTEKALLERGTTLAPAPTESLLRRESLKNTFRYPVWVKHSQFITLTRSLWQNCFAKTDQTDDFEDVIAADEHYYGTIIASRNMLGLCSRKPVTFVKWPNGGNSAHPITLNSVPEVLYDTGDCLFARKFSKVTAINSKYLERIVR